MAEMSNKKNASNSGNKTKKSKNDLIRISVGQYLKQKSYVGSEKFRKSDFMLQQNKKQFVFNKMIEGDLKNGNSFVYSNVLYINNNKHIVDQQFGRFTQFVEAQQEYVRLELRRFYAPLLCHLYLELIKTRENKSALDFLKKYAHLVAPVDNYEAPLPTKVNGCSVPDIPLTAATGVEDGIIINTQIKFVPLKAAPVDDAEDDADDEDPEQEFFTKLIQTLSTCIKLETAEHHEEVRLFRCSKYELYLSEEAFNTLNKFLQKKGHVLILNLLYTWIRINIIDNEVRQWTEDYLFNGPDDDDEDDYEVDAAELGVVKIEEERSTTKRSASAVTAVKRSAEEPADAATVSDAEQTANKGRDRNVQLCLKTITESSEKLLTAQAEFPRFIKVSDKSKRLTCAHLDQHACHLVAGYDSALIQLWQMNQQTCRGKNIYQRHENATCQWELNNFCDEAEDETELEVKMHETDAYDIEETERYIEAKYAENSINDYGGINLRGHTRGVTDVRFSVHYPLLYSVAKDATMRCWRAENYACAAVYRGHTYPIWCVDESPVGMYTATGSRDFTARLWSLDREFPLITYVGHTQDVECLAFHPNGNYIATGSADLSVRLWCVTSGKLMRVFSDCKQPVTCIAFSPDGKMLAAAGEETKIRIFDLAAGSQLSELKEHTASVTSMTWSSSGRLLASGCQDGSMRMWDVTKLAAPSESSSSSTTNASTTTSTAAGSRLMALSGSCTRLVRVLFSQYETLSCIGN